MCAPEREAYKTCCLHFATDFFEVLHARIFRSRLTWRRYDLTDFSKPVSSHGRGIEDVHLSPEERAMYLDLLPFVNASPYFVSEDMALNKVRTLRALYRFSRWFPSSRSKGGPSAESSIYVVLALELFKDVKEKVRVIWRKSYPSGTTRTQSCSGDKELMVCARSFHVLTQLLGHFGRCVLVKQKRFLCLRTLEAYLIRLLWCPCFDVVYLQTGTSTHSPSLVDTLYLADCAFLLNTDSVPFPGRSIPCSATWGSATSWSSRRRRTCQASSHGKICYTR